MTTLGRIIEEDVPTYPGDADRTRTERLSAAVRQVMWPRDVGRYPSPVETDEHDEIADLTPDEFFADMPPIEADRG